MIDIIKIENIYIINKNIDKMPKTEYDLFIEKVLNQI